MNSRGQGIVIFITILPVAVSLIFLTQKTYTILLKKSQTSHICRKGLLAYQEVQQQGLNKLLELNPLASQLRLKRSLAEKAYRTAIRLGQPKAIAAALIVKTKIITRQKALATKQKMILEQTNLSSHFILKKLKNDLKSVLHLKENPQLKGNLSLQVYPSPSKSESPNYITRTNFTKKQNLQIVWNLNLFTNADNFSQFKTFLSKPIQVNCSASLIKEDLKWIPTLSETVKL